MSIQATTYEAIQAINKAATLPSADRAQRLIALLQIQRHIDGLVQKAKDENRSLNPVNQSTGD